MLSLWFSSHFQYDQPKTVLKEGNLVKFREAKLATVNRIGIVLDDFGTFYILVLAKLEILCASCSYGKKQYFICSLAEMERSISWLK